MNRMNEQILLVGVFATMFAYAASIIYKVGYGYTTGLFVVVVVLAGCIAIINKFDWVQWVFSFSIVIIMGLLIMIFMGNIVFLVISIPILYQFSVFFTLILGSYGE